MDKVILKSAVKADIDTVLEIDFLKRKKAIENAVAKNECYLIMAEGAVVGFLIFNYNFFGRGFLELIEIKKDLQGKGFGGAAIKKVFEFCKTSKLFTSANESNELMKKCLSKLDFVFAGKIKGLDDGDPELFYYKILK